jgi:hypothetical protein
MRYCKWGVFALLLTASSVLKAQAADSAAKAAAARADSIKAAQSAKPGGAGAGAAGGQTAPAKPDPGDTSSLTVLVRTYDGRRVERAFVKALNVSAKDTIGKTTRTDPSGYFHFDKLAAGTYEITVDSTASPKLTAQFKVSGPVAGNVELSASAGAPSFLHTFWTVVLLLIYMTTIIFARWHRIARPVHAMIRSQLKALKVRLETEVDRELPQVSILLEAVKELEAAEAAYPQGEKDRRYLEFIFWSRGRENATWVGIHNIERELAAVLSPESQVDANLRWAAAELRQSRKSDMVLAADSITTAISSTPPASLDFRRAILGHAIKLIYAERDSTFAGLMEWQNKASWLILTALVFIAFLSGAVGNSILFLAGAFGGYSSRLMRALKRDDIPLDYGASWTTLFLSPLFGAITGWFGIALLSLAARPELNLLGSAFRLADWNNPFGSVTLAIAFLMGFSERLFDAVVGALEKNAGVSAQSSSPPGSSTPAASAAAGGATNAGAATVAPTITGITQQKAAGTLKDALIVKGAGFVSTATATVFGVPHDIEFKSATELLVALKDDDLAHIEKEKPEVTITTPTGKAKLTMP